MEREIFVSPGWKLRSVLVLSSENTYIIQISSRKTKCSDREKISEAVSLHGLITISRKSTLYAPRVASRRYESEIKRASFRTEVGVSQVRATVPLISTRLSFVGLYYRFLNRIRYLRPVPCAHGRGGLTLWRQVTL